MGCCLVNLLQIPDLLARTAIPSKCWNLAVRVLARVGCNVVCGDSPEVLAAAAPTTVVTAPLAPRCMGPVAPAVAAVLAATEATRGPAGANGNPG